MTIGTLTTYGATQHLKPYNLAATPLPAAWYLALCSATPTIAGGGTELTGGAYARTVAPFATPASGSIGGVTQMIAANSADILFPIASAAWTAAPYWGLYDASTSGNLWWFGELAGIDDNPRTITAAGGDRVVVYAGTIKLGFV